MYETHFGFNGSPFQLNPDPAFYFDSRGHSNALAYLKFGAHQGEGFIVVTGEIGAGKTTLVRTLLEGLDPDKVVAAQVVSTQLESGELLQAILMAFGIESKSKSKAHLIASLEAFLTALAAKGRRALLIIDEAQNLKHEAIEELRMLSNFQLGQYGLLQSFLVGQPELRGLLQSKSMEQLRQRVIASCHLGPLDQAETRAYVEHRMRHVGWRGTGPGFAPDVMDRVHHWTGGVPRRINRLCNRLLLGAFLADAQVVSAAMVDETALELRNEIGEASSEPAPLAASGMASSTALAQPPRAQVTRVDSLTPSPAPSPTSVFSSQTTGSAPKSPAVTAALPKSVTTAQAGSARGHSRKAARPRTEKVSPAMPPVVPEVRRVHRAVALDEPIVCLINSAADYLKAGVLGDAFNGFPSLPRLVAVHIGAEADLELDDLEHLDMPLPAMGLHLGLTPDSFAARSSKLLHAFDALLNEIQPRVIMVLGSSDADLACTLLARKRGFPLLRVVSGKREAAHAAGAASNAVLIDKVSDIVYTDSAETFYALYREGVHLDRVHSVGNLSRETLDMALTHGHGSRAAIGTVPGVDPSILAGTFGLITIDPRAPSQQTVELARTVELLSQFSRELPLLWSMRPAAIGQFESSAFAKQVKASRLLPFVSAGFRQSLALLSNSKYLIARPDGPWLEEAKLLGVSSLVLSADASLGVNGALAEKGEAAQGTALSRLIGTPVLTELSPQYWDAGTANRMARHLVAWFAARVDASPTPASTAADAAEPLNAH